MSSRIRKAFGKPRIDEDIVYENPSFAVENASPQIVENVSYEDPTYYAGNQSTSLSDSVSYA